MSLALCINICQMRNMQNVPVFRGKQYCLGLKCSEKSSLRKKETIPT